MIKKLLITLFTVLLSFSAMAKDELYWKKTWNPTLDMHEVVVYMNYTYQHPVPCGDIPNAIACSGPPDPRITSIQITAPECVIHVDRVDDLPWRSQLIKYGEKMIECLRGRWSSANHSWERNFLEFRAIALVIKYDNSNLPSRLTGRQITVAGDPCGITIAPFKQNERPSRDLKESYGHETLHCIRGRWHDK